MTPAYLRSRLPETVENALHAVAFHENRRLFRVTLFENNSSPSTDLQEVSSPDTYIGLILIIEKVWFPGCHSDVGGGGEEKTDLPKISLEWMLVGHRNVSTC